MRIEYLILGVIYRAVNLIGLYAAYVISQLNGA